MGAIFKTLQSNSEMRSGMPRAARRPTYLANSVNAVNPVLLLDLVCSRRWFAPLGSENSHLILLHQNRVGIGWFTLMWTRTHHMHPMVMACAISKVGSAYILPICKI
jgi:hypothetical protein